jgi:molybdopterin converting factor subunit 1
MKIASARFMMKSQQRIRYESTRYPSKLRLMTVRVLAFARLREILAAPETSLELSEPAAAADAWAALLRDHPALAAERATTRVARNGRLVAFDEPLSDGDELAFLPPVGGG